MGLLDRLTSEVAYLRGALRTLNRVKPVALNPNHVLCDLMEEAAAQFADRPALVGEDDVWTFRDMIGRVNRVARWARAEGIGKGDTVALLLNNCRDYPLIWLGIARAGGATALINTNLTGQGLAHSVSIVKAKKIIVGMPLLGAWQAAEPLLDEKPEILTFGGSLDGCKRFENVRDAQSAEPLAANEKVPLTIEDRCVYIYTSGTTGLPKAANINHYRIKAMALGFSAVMDVQPDDRMYDCLPLYHSNGGVLATYGVLCQGGSVVIRERFSAREFWNEIIRFNCTLFFYIGELCRYLVNQAPTPQDRQHKIRLICGNGLRPDIWSEFVDRFGIRNIREFYAATEGNIALFNFDSKPGSVGRIPKWAERRFVVKVVRYDVEREEPVRGPDGFCQACGPDEIGEIMGQILNDPMKPANRFEGYADKDATEKKILRNAFAEGDAWFRSGDLLKRDAQGYFYFIDRIGDTFRWKGENVATSEVAEAMGVFPGIDEANVYGVHVPGYDGRAGMAAIALSANEDIDFDALYAELKKRLPPYARPVFLRIRTELEHTGTFKIKKVDLVKEGFDPTIIADPLWFDHPTEGRYVRLDADLHAQIVSKGIRL
jgi:fatty-acyl-CoA synthase